MQMDLKGLGDALGSRYQAYDDGWGKWQATTDVLNAYADYDRSIAPLGTTHELAPSDYYF
jgi:hypothetical protein